MLRYKRMRRLFAATLLAACSGGATQVAIGPVPPARTTGTLAGPLCEYDHCTCADAEHDPGVPDGTRKRFEFVVMFVWREPVPSVTPEGALTAPAGGTGGR